MTKDTIKARRPKPGMWIVWRYKGDKGWQVSYVRDSFGAGYVVHLTDNEYGGGFGGVRVCADDIDWKIK